MPFGVYAWPNGSSDCASSPRCLCAQREAIVVTDDKDRLVRAIYERAGEKQTAMAASTPEAGKSKAMGAGLG